MLELVEGPTLADRISKGPIPVDEALPIANQIAEALEAAHEAGVIHRDLKPANIKVREDGTVKVLDFGLAKALEPDPTSAAAANSPTISLTAAATQMGMVIGTAAYMAPEQAKGKVVDKRADVWAFGAVLYEMLTGQKPFTGDDVSTTLARVIEREPDWDALPTRLSPVLATYLRRCLAKEPKQRVHDIADVRLAMEGAFEMTFNTPSEPGVVPTLPVWQRPVTIAVAVLASLVVGGFAVWSLTRPAPPLPGLVTRFAIPLAADQTFSFNGRPIVAVSPDGSQVVYTANPSLWLRPVDQLQAVQVPGTEEGRGPFFSADGQSIGFWADTQLKKVSVSGGAPVTLADVPANPGGASWGADDMILYGQADGIWQVPGASGTPERLIQVDEGERIHGPQMLPGGEWVLFTVRSASQTSWNEAQIVAQSVATDERTVLIDGGRDGRYLPTGHLVYGLNNVLLAVPFDVGSRQVTGGPVPLVEGVREAFRTLNGAAQFSVSTTGSLVYVPSATGVTTELQLVWVNRQGDVELLPVETAAYRTPRLWPDGQRLAVGTITDGGENIWIHDLQRGGQELLTVEGNSRWPVWTDDGTHITFASTRPGSGTLQLFKKPIDGSGPAEPLLDLSDDVAIPVSWSSEARTLGFYKADLTAPGGPDSDIWVLPEDGPATPFITGRFSERSPSLSPDGRWLAYVSNESGRNDVYIRPYPGPDPRRLVSTNGGTEPVWARDGRELFYRSGSGMFAVRIDVEGERVMPRSPELLFEGPYAVDPIVGVNPNYDVASDGRFLMVRTDPETRNSTPPQIIFVENWTQELLERVPIN